MWIRRSGIYSLLVIWCYFNPTESSTHHGGDSGHFMNEFAVRIPRGGREAADRVAQKHGFHNRGPIGSLDGYYLFEHHHVSKRSLDVSHHHHSLLDGETEVEWFQQQRSLKRIKRDAYEDDEYLSASGPDYNTGSDYEESAPREAASAGHPARSPVMHPFSPRSLGPASNFPDPLYGEQWYLHNGAAGGFDMNVIQAWQKGYTGKGIVVSILDDGIQTNHPDLIQNYDQFASTDINSNDDDPMPQDNGDNKHGTRCAGEVAATAYNGLCGVGVAYNASIGGVRMLDGTVNDAVEARALSHNPQHIDIYSASWGPEDDGKTVDGPGPLAMQAFIDGVNKGRNGKGSIFIWASGNGGRHADNCNCDGYTNSIYTLSISSATQHGQKPWYLEECSSTLASTYSSGTPGHDRSVVTVDMDMSFNPHNMCTKEHTGTSASAPIAAAIAALALEANPHLTWRDMQYLVMLTSRPEPLMKEDGWITNGVSRKVNHKFGYGLMDASAMVTLAERWRIVPPQRICDLPPDTIERVIPNEYRASAEFYLDTDGCFGTARQVNFLEHVQARVSLNFSPRGNLRIILQSPFGTRSTLLFPRPRDLFKTNFDDWPFLSVHFWGERPAGRWRLTIINDGSKPALQPGVLKHWSLVFYGTEINPVGSGSNTPPRSPDFMNFGASSASMTVVAYGNATSMNTPQEKGCHEECAGGCHGLGADQCNSCRHLTVNTGQKSVCVRECDDGWFATRDQLCLKCHPSCTTCADGGPGDCLTCPPNLLLLRIADQTQCVPECPAGYSKGESRTCNPCSSTCERCSSGPSLCTKCRFGLLLYKNTCVASCPKGTYRRDDLRCSPCHYLCDTCVGSGLSECVTCPTGSYHLNGTCVKKCPPGFYPDPSSNECYR